jgi:hypothetical protein
MTQKAPSSPFGWPVRLVLLALIWGMSFVFIKLGVES